MHREDVLEIEFFQLGHYPAQIIVGRRSQVEAADQRVDLVDAADLLGALQRVDDAAVPAWVITTSPRSPSRKQVACSCQC